MNGDLISFKAGSQESNEALLSGFWSVHGQPRVAIPREMVPLTGGQSSLIFELSDPSIRFNFLQLLVRCARLNQWWAILFPALWVFVYWARSGSLSGVQVAIGVAAGASALLLQIAGFALNDVSDHLRLIDLPGRARGSGVLQEGVASARQLKSFAYALIGAATVFALPALWQDPLPCLALGGLVLLLSLGFSNGPAPIKYGLFGDFVLFLLYGPLFTAGFSRIVLGRLDLGVVAGGCFFGLLSWLIAHLRNLQDLDFDRGAQVRSLATEFGFRGARHFYLGLLFLAYFGVAGATILLGLPALGLVLLSFVIPRWVGVVQKLYRASGPVSALFGEIEQGTRKGVVESAAAYLLGSVLQLLYGS